MIYDTAQIVKERFDHRNYIKANGQKVLLTVPLLTESWFKPFKDVKINNVTSWRLKHWQTIEMAYHKAPYFSSYSAGFKKIFEQEHDSLTAITIPLIREILRIMGWDGKIICSSALPIDTSLRSTDALIEILQKVGATSYLAGASSKKYLNETPFTRLGIGLEYHHFEHPTYNQLGQGFISHLAAIDAIFNIGEKIKEIMQL